MTKQLKDGIKFTLTHYGNYLDVLLGLEERDYKSELIEFRRQLKESRVLFNEEERVGHEIELFIKYLELEKIIE